jgi:hypothetical protein
MIVGFPLLVGNTNFGSDGAISSTRGTGASSMYDGENHEASSCEIVILAELCVVISLPSLHPLLLVIC